MALAQSATVLAEEEEKKPDHYYSFVVIAWYEDIAPEPLEISYNYLQDCEEGKERVKTKLALDKEKDDKFGYRVTECKRMEVLSEE